MHCAVVSPRTRGSSLFCLYGQAIAGRQDPLATVGHSMNGAFPLLDESGGSMEMWDAVAFSERPVLPTSAPMLPLAAGAPCAIAPCLRSLASGTDASNLDMGVTRSTVEVLERLREIQRRIHSHRDAAASAIRAPATQASQASQASQESQESLASSAPGAPA